RSTPSPGEGSRGLPSASPAGRTAPVRIRSACRAGTRPPTRTAPRDRLTFRSMSGWSWLALAGLGAFHGITPAMGWLFAVALGLHRQSRPVVLRSLIPIAVGHPLAIALVALPVAMLAAVPGPRGPRVAS